MEKKSRAKSYQIIDGKKVTSESRKAQMREYQRANMKALLEYQNEYKRKNKIKDPIRILERDLKLSLSRYIRKQIEWSTNSRMCFLIKLSYPDFIKKLESQFKKGMTIENYGRGRGNWHFNFIVPCSTATSFEELIKLFHWSNIEPMWN